VAEHLTTAADVTITGTVETAAERDFTVAGYVNTSHGRVETTIRQHVEFSNDQEFVNSATQFVQNITQTTEISSGTETKQGGAVLHSEKKLSYPLSLDISFVVNADGSAAQTTTSDQTFESQEARGGNAGSNGLSRITNNVKSTDTLLFNSAGALTGFQDRRSSQTYTSQDPRGVCFNRSIAAADGVLTSITDAPGCGGDH